MANIEVGTEARAGATRAVHLQKKIARSRPRQHSHGESHNSDLGREENPAQDNAKVVNQGCERRDHKLGLGVLHRAQDAAQVKTDLRRQHEPREENQASLLSGPEPRRDERGELGRQDFRQRHQRHQREAHHANNRGEDAPALLLAVLRHVLGEDRDEGQAKRAGRDQVVEKVGEGERRVIGVGNGVRTDLMGDRPLAEEAQQAAGQDAGHHDAGRLCDSPCEGYRSHSRQVAGRSKDLSRFVVFAHR